jgi:S-adenosylmethionine:tRNA ribosyltransferase-isomerase
MTPKLPVSDYDYAYPEELIATVPIEPRDSSRLLVLERATGRVAHRIFRDIPTLLHAGDCIVLNRTKVMPCRLIGKKSTGGKVDMLLVQEIDGQTWTALSSGLKLGQKIEFTNNMSATVGGLTQEGEYKITFNTSDIRPYLAEFGLPPLPPYIAKKRLASRDDAARYQTVYAQIEGSIAAPTAGLHFTQEVLTRLTQNGVRIAWVVLHVGRGTFRPISSDDADQHTMLPERYEVSAEDAALIKQTKATAGRLVAVGTTVTRTLETLARRPEGYTAVSDQSALYIRPGHHFRAVDGLLTNFHLPRSTPLLLASAFAGRDQLLSAYREAVALQYRLFSFGDAMLIL